MKKEKENVGYNKPNKCVRLSHLHLQVLSLTTNQIRKPKRLTKATKCKCLLEAF